MIILDVEQVVATWIGGYAVAAEAGVINDVGRVAGGG